MTGPQRAVLEQLAAGGLFSGRELADAVGTTPDGLHQTAASLVRHGWAARHRRDGRVAYQITEAGRAALYLEQTARRRRVVDHSTGPRRAN